MALDDDGMKNQYLTKLRVKIREDSDIMRELTEMLQDFALSYNAELNSAGNVDQYNPRAQEFLEAWEALRQDFDVWVHPVFDIDCMLNLLKLLRFAPSTGWCNILDSDRNLPMKRVLASTKFVLTNILEKAIKGIIP